MKKFILLLIIFLAGFLRTWNLAEIPPSIYWDEASLGYNAYSILQTGKDEHGRFMPLTNFAAFGDYKPPGYIYASVPSIAVFDLTEFAIRFPSALFGILTVALTYLLARKLFRNETIALIAAFFLSISPWHIQMSRAAFEANMALFFSVLGIYAFFKFASEKPIYIFISALTFLIAMYTFTGQRLFVPLILIILAIQFRKQIIDNFKVATTAAILSLFLLWPLLIFSTQTIEGSLRFNEVTIFKDLKPIEQSTRYRERNNFAWWSNIVHNRRFFYAREYLKHYFDAFNPSFLFVSGDGNPRLSIQNVGALYYFDLPLILAGIYFLFRKNHKYKYFILGWLLISPLGPATARETPHALRMIHILPIFQLLSAFGLFYLYRKINRKKLLLTMSIAAVIGSLFYYLHQYYFHYPRNYSGQWQFGYKQAVEETNKHLDLVDNVVVTKSLGRPYIYFLFFSKFKPDAYHQDSVVTRDEFYFLDVEKFGKFHFGDPDKELEGRTLYVVRQGNLPGFANRIKTIENLKGEPVFDIGIKE